MNPDRRYQLFFWHRCEQFRYPGEVIRDLVFSFIISCSLIFVISLLSCYLFENPKKILVIRFHYLKLTKNIRAIAQKRLGEYATPTDDFIRAHITHPAVDAETYEIKPNLLSLVQQNQFGGSSAEDS